MGTVDDIQRKNDVLRFPKQLWSRQAGDCFSSEVSTVDSNFWLHDTAHYDGQAKQILIRGNR